MAWTNAIPIIHNGVTEIMRLEIPEFTKPYIDGIPVRGPATRYELPGGGFETIPENSGIRLFVWIHILNMDRILQQIKYCRRRFSGPKAIICLDKIKVVGHLCTYEGQRPLPSAIAVMNNWGPCVNVSDVCSFLGTSGVCRIFIKGFAELAAPLNKLLRIKNKFCWESEEKENMENLKSALKSSGAIRPLCYKEGTKIGLAVDTFYLAIGYYIYQVDKDDPKEEHYT